MRAEIPVTTPAFRVHKATGQAYIYVRGRRQYLGRHDKPETLQKYHQLVAEILASGGQLPVEPSDIRIKELAARFWVWAEGYYVKSDGTPTRELDNIRQALRPLKELYADTPVMSFSPRALMAVRQKMIEAGWCRGNINRNIGRIKTMIRWGTEQELVPGSVYHAVQAVAGLKRGRSGAREAEPVRPVPLARVHAIKPFVSKQVWALIELQLFTGARAGELVVLRKKDINRDGKVWSCTPDEHKTAHHRIRRTIYFGPKAQRVLEPFLLRHDDQYLFRPDEAERERRRMAHEMRETPPSCGNRPGTNRTAKPKRPPGECYDVAAYRRAIARGCDQAFAPPEHLARQEGETRRAWMRRLTADQKKALGHQRLQRPVQADSAQLLAGQRPLQVGVQQRRALARRRPVDQPLGGRLSGRERLHPLQADLPHAADADGADHRPAEGVDRCPQLRHLRNQRVGLLGKRCHLPRGLRGPARRWTQ